MSFGLAILLTAGVAGVAAAAMLLVRRRAPEGSFFEDGDRASGVFGVLATGFFLLLGFVIFLAFESYDHRGAGRRPADPDGAVLRARRRTEAHRRADLLRPLGRPAGVGEDA